MLCLISDANVLPGLAECEFHIACDVSNPLCGDNGCSVVYGPQKGAGPELIPQMDRWLADYARLAGELGYSVQPDYPGAGAAGGLGFAFTTKDASACNESGIDAFFPILRNVCTLEEAMDSKNAQKNMTDTVEQAFRLIRAVSSPATEWG